MILPKNYDGRPMISYSQVNGWKAKTGFNTKLKGQYEYIRRYFLGEKFPSNFWSDFGNEVEAYICERKCGEMFTNQEKQKLEEIETLGIFQHKGIIDFDDFVLLLYIDDKAKDFSKIRDIKTASENSKKQYYENTYKQLDVYSLYVYKEKGFIPESEVCIVERLGSSEAAKCQCREELKVGENIWYLPKKSTKDKIISMEKDIRETAKEISEYYQVYLKMCGNNLEN